MGEGGREGCSGGEGCGWGKAENCTWTIKFFKINKYKSFKYNSVEWKYDSRTKERMWNLMICKFQINHGGHKSYSIH